MFCVGVCLLLVFVVVGVVVVVVVVVWCRGVCMHACMQPALNTCGLCSCFGWWGVHIIGLCLCLVCMHT